MESTFKQDQEVIREFLIESHENLSRLDQEMVALEKHPTDAALLGSIFRTIHTLKGSCGFLAFHTLEKITHQAENILSKLRDGKRELTPYTVSLILETVDATRRVLTAVEAEGDEGSDTFDDLTERLRLAAQGEDSDSKAPHSVASTSSGSPVYTAADLTPSDEDGERTSAVAESNIRVGVEILDKLMDLVGELVLTRNQILQSIAEREDAALNASAQRLNLITSELQEGVMKTRMQPIGTVWNKLPRVVRDVALSLGKQVRLEMDGAETELDRTIIEAIKDPLLHLVRNACDHGIELPDIRVKAGKSVHGTLSLRAYHEGGQVIIEMGDDGSGVDVARVKQKAVEKGLLRTESAEDMSDREALQLIFQPALSTADKVTNLSGRGVGMDVVKSNVEKIGGVVDVFSQRGEGTTVKLKIPLTLAIVPGLVVTSGGERFVIPQVSLLELIRLESDSSGKHIEFVHGVPVYRRRGSLLPVVYLNRVLGMKAAQPGEAVSIVVLQAEDRQFGLVVDAISDTQEIVVKPLGKQFKGLTVYAGAAIMGDGRVALIVDVLGIGQISGVFSESQKQARTAVERKPPSEIEPQRLLVFRTGSFERVALPLSLVSRLEEFPPSSIERAGGCQVVQYRDRILPLVSLRDVLEPDASNPPQASEFVQVVVVSDGERSAGLLVDQILDIVEEPVRVPRKTGRKGLLGSAVVGSRVTDFLDLDYVLRTATAGWFQDKGTVNAKTVLLADGSAFSRGLIRSGLDLAGYRVIEAANVQEATRSLGESVVDVVVAALNLPPTGSSGLRVEMLRRSDWESIPLLALADSSQHLEAQTDRTAYEDCRSKHDREGMLDSLTRLASAIRFAETSPSMAGRNA